MDSFGELLALSAVMSLSILLSLPLVLHRRAQGRAAVVLLAAAIGILIFLLADIFSDVAPLLTQGASAEYLTAPGADAIFLAAVVGAFLVLYVLDNHTGGGAERSPYRTGLIIALGIGFQNLTEGLVFGAAWVAGVISLVTVVFTGFVLQNVTEGFPIAAPFLGTPQRRVSVLVGLMLIGGLPTMVGSVIGFFYNSTTLVILFDGVAIGAIAYVILPMLRGAFRPMDTPEASRRKYQLISLGVLAGFALGFLVNAI